MKKLAIYAVAAALFGGGAALAQSPVNPTTSAPSRTQTGNPDPQQAPRTNPNAPAMSKKDNANPPAPATSTGSPPMNDGGNMTPRPPK